MPRPRYCRNPECPYSQVAPAYWLVRDGTYRSRAHGAVQRYRCRHCNRAMSDQTESMHYYAKRRLNLLEIFSRIRGGSSLRDIGRELGCSRSAIANAVLRLGRQAIACHAVLLRELALRGDFAFDGLVSALESRDYPVQITTLVDRSHELLLAMTHAVTERGGRRTASQRRRIAQKRLIWNPKPNSLMESISLLVNELPRHAIRLPICIHTDEHPLYASAIRRDLAMQWYAMHGQLHVRRTAGRQARTTRNPLFAVNYVDRMLRHRMKEHARESIAIGRNATMQMHRMWVFAWDHNVRQPERVAVTNCDSRAVSAGVDRRLIRTMRREFATRRQSLRRVPISESLRMVWLGRLETPPVRWSTSQKRSRIAISNYARIDLSFANPHGP